MRKSIISFLLLFVCMPFVWAVNSMSAITFNIPASWEYNSTADAYSFVIMNNGDDFDGKIVLCAKDENGNVFELFSETIFVEANAQLEYTHYFNDEIQLNEGVYSFFFKYEQNDGELIQDVVTGKGIVRAPSSTTRIPITTTTDPGKLTLSSTLVRNESQISIYSNEEMKEVNLVDMNGKVVLSKKVGMDKEVELGVEGLTNGQYIVVGKTSTGVLSAKMLKINN